LSERRQRVGNTGNGFAYEEPLVFERSRAGRIGCSLPEPDVPKVDPEALLPRGAVREDLPGLPELSEVEVVRHFTRLSTWNAAVDLGLYPLGSCTMKRSSRWRCCRASSSSATSSRPSWPS
jgi:glycine dehydrogenase subunit 2